jgi:hypothetical protein
MSYTIYHHKVMSEKFNSSFIHRKREIFYTYWLRVVFKHYLYNLDQVQYYYIIEKIKNYIVYYLLRVCMF